MPTSHQALFEANLDYVRRTASAICARNGFSREDSEDFVSALIVKLMEDDYAVIGKYRGRGNIQVYLVTVARHFFQDYRNKLWGKWKPSAEAKRLGPTAVQLDMLTSRDGHSLDVAIGILRDNHGVNESEAELVVLYNRLPYRSGRTELDEATLGELPAVGGSGELALLEKEKRERFSRADAVMQKTLAGLEPEERLLVKLVYHDGLKIAEIARRLGTNQKKLYRWVDKIIVDLRREMERAGVR
ncbi:MAG: sigma-70 family RNA polymerase sigma factor [Acidobacteriota bacterium]|nr:sigma-70 family RNA polymerase sigma factor [Acidobacteriota bacterium]